MDNFEELWEDIHDKIRLDYMDWRVLTSYPEEIRCDYVIDHGFDLINVMISRMKEHGFEDYAETSYLSLDNCPAHLSAMCPNERMPQWYDNLTRRTLKKDVRCVMFSAYRLRGKGMHEMMFGQQLPVVLSRNAELFLVYLKRMQASARRKVIAELNKNRSLTDCPWYLFQTRIKELAGEQSLSYKEMLRIRSERNQNIQRKVLFSYRDVVMRELSSVHQKNLEDVRFLKIQSVEKWYLLYLACVTHGISADRFLLQDYSQCAVWSNGEPLNQTEQTMLSSFLCASQEAQAEALGHCMGEVLAQGFYWK